MALAVCALAVPVVASGSSSERPNDKQPGPAIKLPLDKLGFPGVSNSFLDVGSSMLTLHFLDDSHLLLTYSERKLVPRVADDPRDDDDRMVAGEVVELPTGKVLAFTEWHMHDHGRYLWSLGHGRFLLRIRNTLYTMAPLANLASEPPTGGGVAADPFARAVFPARGVRPSAVFVSEDGGLVTLEAQVNISKQSNVTEVGDNINMHPEVITLMDFFRLQGDGSSASPLVANPAGGVRSADPFYLPIDSDGYLWPAEVANNHWAVTFDDFRGKTASMGTLDSSCVPRLEMVSPSEFVALTCRGADDRVRMASYGLDGQETWQEDFGDFGPPVFAYAPGAGRFAVSRTVSAVAPSPGMASTIPGSPARQEVRVYQTASGDLLLKVETSPVFKTAENFDLSADGTLAAVVKNGAVEVYKLPALSKRDKEDIAEVAKFAPPPASGPVLLKLLAAPSGSARTAKATENAVPASASSAVPVAADKSAPADSSPGDAAASAPAPRKAPTLLNPGEKPEFGGSAQPN